MAAIDAQLQGKTTAPSHSSGTRGAGCAPAAGRDGHGPGTRPRARTRCDCAGDRGLRCRRRSLNRSRRTAATDEYRRRRRMRRHGVRRAGTGSRCPGRDAWPDAVQLRSVGHDSPGERGRGPHRHPSLRRYRAAATIAWWTGNGTAIADSDYADLGARVERFEPGEQSRTVYVPLTNDSHRGIDEELQRLPRARRSRAGRRSTVRHAGRHRRRRLTRATGSAASRSGRHVRG